MKWLGSNMHRALDSRLPSLPNEYKYSFFFIFDMVSLDDRQRLSRQAAIMSSNLH